MINEQSIKASFSRLVSVLSPHEKEIFKTVTTKMTDDMNKLSFITTMIKFHNIYHNPHGWLMHFRVSLLIAFFPNRLMWLTCAPYSAKALPIIHNRHLATMREDFEAMMDIVGKNNLSVPRLIPVLELFKKIYDDLNPVLVRKIQ